MATLDTQVGGEPWTLSHRSRVKHNARSRASRTSAPTSSSPRSRNRHEPVPFGRTSHLVGWHMSAQRREVPASVDPPPAQGCSMAQKRRWCSAPWAAVKKGKTATYRPNSTAIKARRGPKKAIMAVRSLPSLPLSTTCSRMGTMYKDPRLQSLRCAVQPTSKNNAWLNASLNLGTLWRSS